MRVTVHSTSADGTPFEISIAKTGDDTADIAFTSEKDGVKHTDSYSVHDVQANATTLNCTATFIFWHPKVVCQVDTTRPPGGATVRVTISDAPMGNGSTDYRLSAAEGQSVLDFLAGAGFPGIDGANA